MDKLISIIVPVYKIEAYIGQCIESILSQTYKELEIILVDDGSPDNCGKICDEYALMDKRIKVIHKKNGGLSEARNYGLAEAHGEYISFIDGDDYIDKSFYQMLLEAAEKNNCDIAECHSVNFEDGKNPQSIYRKGKNCLTPFEWLTESSVGEFLPCVVWNKIYKKELFNDVTFPVGRHYEDEATTYKAVYKANRIIRINSALYFYRQRDGSITQAEKTINEINEQYMALEEKYLFFKKNNEMRIAKFAEAKLAIYMISVYWVRRKLTGECQDWRKKIRNVFNDIYGESIVPLKYKIYLLLFVISPNLCKRN